MTERLTKYYCDYFNFFCNVSTRSVWLLEGSKVLSVTNVTILHVVYNPIWLWPHEDSCNYMLPPGQLFGFVWMCNHNTSSFICSVRSYTWVNNYTNVFFYDTRSTFYYKLWLSPFLTSITYCTLFKSNCIYDI